MSIIRPTRQEIAKYAGSLGSFLAERKLDFIDQIYDLEFEVCGMPSGNGDIHAVQVSRSGRNPSNIALLYTISHSLEYITPISVEITPEKEACPIRIVSVDKPLEGYARFGSDRYQNSIWGKQFHVLDLGTLIKEFDTLAKG